MEGSGPGCAAGSRSRPGESELVMASSFGLGRFTLLRDLQAGAHPRANSFHSKGSPNTGIAWRYWESLYLLPPKKAELLPPEVADALPGYGTGAQAAIGLDIGGDLPR